MWGKKKKKKITKSCNNFKKCLGFRKEIWIMDPATDQYYRWLTIIAGPVFYNLMMIVTRYRSFHIL